MKRNPFVITAGVAALIVVAALATLGVLSAVAGEKSGLDRAGRHECPKVSAKAVRDVTDPGYGTRLANLSRCR